MSTGLDVGVLRAGAVLAPLVLTAALWLAAPTVRLRGAAVLAALWNVIGLLAVNALAVHLGWWSFGTSGTQWAGVPVDVVLGWALLWGAVPVLLLPWVNIVASATVLIVADALVMGSLQPLVTLSGTWLYGEIVAVATCLVPGAALGYLTARSKGLRTRVGLQVVLFSALLLFLCPAVTFAATGTSWQQVSADIGGPVDLVLAQGAALVAIVALRAVADFARAGGTPYPWDPPTRLVTAGPYAFVANPMQLAGVLLLVLTAAITAQPTLVAAAALALMFSVGLAWWSERDDLIRRFGDTWLRYRHEVRNWLPRWTPYPDRPQAWLYVAVSCDPCSSVGDWLSRRHPIALTIEPAEEYPEPLRRIRYECEDGLTLSGTRAAGAALEHVSLGYAMVGWLLRAPVLASFLQLLADAVGAGPRSVTGGN